MTNDEYEKMKTAQDPVLQKKFISYLCREIVKKDEEIADLKRTKNIAIEIQKNVIAELQSDLNLYIDLCDKKDEEIAALKAEIENEYELSVYRSSWES